MVVAMLGTLSSSGISPWSVTVKDELRCAEFVGAITLELLFDVVRYKGGSGFYKWALLDITLLLVLLMLALLIDVWSFFLLNCELEFFSKPSSISIYFGWIVFIIFF